MPVHERAAAHPEQFSQQYGRIEARIQIPKGQGLWPAFWMLGADINTSGWPTCGEIDIMENIGKEPSTNNGSLHMPAAGTSNDDDLTGTYTLPGNAKLGDDFHTYAIEWSAAAIKFYVDDNLYETQTPSTATGRTWKIRTIRSSCCLTSLSAASGRARLIRRPPFRKQ